MSWEYLHWGHFNKDQKCWWSLMFPLFLKEMTWHMHLSYTTMTNHKQQHCLSANGSPAYFASSRLCDWHLWNPQWFSRPGETFSRSSDDLFYMACTSSLFLQNLFLKVLLPACLPVWPRFYSTHTLCCFLSFLRRTICVQVQVRPWTLRTTVTNSLFVTETKM